MATTTSTFKNGLPPMASGEDAPPQERHALEAVAEDPSEHTTLPQQPSSGSSSPERETRRSQDVSERSENSQDISQVGSIFLQPQALDHRPRARNRSPYSRSHLRSQSATSTLTAPPMARARSSPSMSSSHNWPSLSPSHSPIRPSSPMRSPTATRVTPRRSFEEQFRPGQLPSFVDIEVIEENEELDFRPRATLDRDFQSSSSISSPPPANALGMAFSRPSSSGSSSRRRPSSPLYPSQGSSVQSPASSTKFNEIFPGQALHSATGTSSMPSTPTSFRSRSPSIASLEIIEDSPDAEEDAEEAFNLAKLKAAAEEAEDEENRSGSNRVAAANSREKKKRWSVCGAERRGDFEMETIWEDSAGNA